VSEPSKPADPPEPTLEQLLALMHVTDRQFCESRDFPWAQREAIIEFYRKQWKESHKPVIESPSPAESEPFDGVFQDIDPSQISPHPTPPGEFDDTTTKKSKGVDIHEFQKAYAEKNETDTKTDKTIDSSVERLNNIARDVGQGLLEHAQRDSEEQERRIKKVLEPPRIPEMERPQIPGLLDIEKAVGKAIEDSHSANGGMPEPGSLLRKRALNRFWLFRKLMEYPRLSEGSGVTLSFLIAKQALDYQIGGAIKTAAFVFLLAWAAFALAIYISSFWDKRRPLMMLLLIVTAFGLFTIWWAYLPPPPAPVPPSSQSSPSIGTPSVTLPITNERIFTDVKPEYLTGLYEKYRSAQADEAVKSYIGKWIKVSGNVSDVSREKGYFGSPDTVFISLTVIKPDGHRLYSVLANFDQQRWIDRALIFGRGEEATVLGQISHVTDTSIALRECEIIE
jgi:hypothetical protein